MEISNKIILALKFLIFFLLFFALWNSLIIGGSWDEPFHHINGVLRLRYLISFGDYQNYQYANNQFYPGIYDTFSSTISFLINKFYPEFLNRNFFNIKHFINFTFAALSIYGLFKFIKVISNNELLALFSILLTILNPFFFGHMGINPKDTIIFFALIWFLYFFYKYISKKRDIKNLIYFSVFIGFGCGIRISFLAVIFPMIIFGIIYYIQRFQINIFEFLKIKGFDIILGLICILFLSFITWPHMHDGNINIILQTLKNSISWPGGAKLVLINGNFFETSNTPKTYFLSFLLFKMPIYQSILFFISLFLIFLKKEFFKNKIKEFNKFSFLILFIIFYTVSLTILFNVKIYDGIRLFLFIIPFFCVHCSLTLIYVINNFRKNFSNYIFLTLFICLFFISTYRFIILTPYQYSYINYNFIKLSSASDKFEHDYWNTSWKELIKDLPDTIEGKEPKNFNIGVCGGDPNVAAHYLSQRYKKFKVTNASDAHYLIMTNKASFNKNDKRTCFDIYKGKDFYFVKRGNLILSKFTKIKEID